MKERVSGLRNRKKFTLGCNYLLFLGPALLYFFVIKLTPFLLGIGYSMTDWNGISKEINFSGFANFRKIFTNDSQFWLSMWFTIKYSLVTVVLSNLAGFTLAYFLSKNIPCRNVMRSGFYLPNVIGGIVLGFIWQFIYLNVFKSIGETTGLGFFQMMWLGTPGTAFWGLAIVEVWKLSGYLMLIYIAGLTTLGKEYIEAATIDGANGRQVLRHIILPLLMPSITQCLFLSILNTFKVYDVNLALTAGGPFRSSEAITMNVYQTAFFENQMGLGSAKALILVIFIVVVTQIQVYVTSKSEVQM